jgi:hypothetical protein
LESSSAVARRRDVVGPLILAFAAIELATGAWMLIDPGSFFDNVGPFGTSNPHYTRDAGTFTLALGVVLAIAYVRPAWRLGAVGYAFVQFLFHSINHLVDIDKAHPHRYGVEDFVSLAVGTAVLGWLLLRILRQRGTAAGP